jgi:HK97 family phage major capsid protein
MSISEIKSLLEEQGNAFHEFKKANDDRLAQLEQTGTVVPEVQAKLEAANSHIEELTDRISKAEAEMSTPRANIDPDAITKEQREHRDAFFAALRSPKDQQAQSRLQEAQRKMEVTVGSDAGGGYALPEVIDRNIAAKIVDISPMRSIVDVRTASTTDYKILVNVHGGGYEWVGEGDTRSEQSTPQLAEVAPTFGTIQSYMFATEESLNDLFVDVQGWIENEAAIQHAKGEGIAVISGNGTKKPTGFLNGSPVAVGDEDSPARAFGTLEYLPTGVSDGFGTLDVTSPGLSYPSDVLLDAVYSLKAGYRASARWLMNKATLSVLRKFKDSEGNYLWTPGMAMGQASTLMGYPVTEAEDMADIGANALPVAFGDFREGYCLVDLVGTRITIDPYTTPGKVKFYIRKRVGGKLKNDDAIKVVKCATS